MSAIAITPSTHLETPLEELRNKITSESFKARNAAKKSLDHIRACGDMLIELKSRVGHGRFRHELNWLRIKPSTAANYMKVAVNIQHVGHLGSGMRDALKILTKGDVQIEEPEEIQLLPPAPSPRPASTVIMDAEIVEPVPAVITQEPQHEEPDHHDEAAVRLATEYGIPPAEVVKAGQFADAVEALGLRQAVMSGKNFYEIILVMLPHLTGDEIKSLIEILKNRWLPR